MRVPRTFLVGAALGVFAFSASLCAEPVAPPRPNIVLILADDLGYGDVGCYGCPDIRTPAIDRLATEGVRFTAFYSNGPECTPTRTALMTGCYQQRVPGLECAIGLGNVGRYDEAEVLAARGKLGLPPEKNDLIRGLLEAGYLPVAFGKWHLGYNPEFLPRRHGFAQFFGPLGGAVDYFYHCEPDGTPMLYADDLPTEREGYMTDLITEAAVAFIRQRPKDRPFFLYVAYTAPHTPIQAPGPKPAVPRSEADWNEGDRPTYAAMVERMDEGVAAILNALSVESLDRNTLVIFCSDNGGTSLGRNAPFSGGKGTLFEGGIRVPCVVRWPGVLPAGEVTDQPSMTMDLTCSMLRAAGVPPQRLQLLDGWDILRSVQERAPLNQRTLFWRYRRGTRTWWAVRDRTLKYLEREDSGKRMAYLFDLGKDAAEKHDLLDQYPAERERLENMLRAWEEEMMQSRKSL